jgi:hypothetical protein
MICLSNEQSFLHWNINSKEKSIFHSFQRLEISTELYIVEREDTQSNLIKTNYQFPNYHHKRYIQEQSDKTKSVHKSHKIKVSTYIMQNFLRFRQF